MVGSVFSQRTLRELRILWQAQLRSEEWPDEDQLAAGACDALGRMRNGKAMGEYLCAAGPPSVPQIVLSFFIEKVRKERKMCGSLVSGHQSGLLECLCGDCVGWSVATRHEGAAFRQSRVECKSDRPSVVCWLRMQWLCVEACSAGLAHWLLFRSAGQRG